MSKKFIILILVAIGLAGLFLIRNRLTQKLAEIKKSADIVLEDVKKEILTPPPLRAIRESEQAYLTRGGVIKWTNINRANNGGLAALTENQQLDIAAKLKVQDMFARQYFEHVSPTGGNISTLLDGVGYQFIAVGENLALGNYENDQALVQAWMDSPGHRANILNNRFREIGVAVAQGMFEGRKTWLAVQAFALPLSACPQADETLKTQINMLERQIAELKVKADAILTELEQLKGKGNRELYNQKVNEYNSIDNQINGLIAQLKSLVAQYNEQIKIFNACINQ
ncbi:MAG: CAP domain-containing protein [Candidatus Buchananbacteria bacterium]|nr:CAP domain-containing protein [Candidatus Buchananbacteria bacterium]